MTITFSSYISEPIESGKWWSKMSYFPLKDDKAWIALSQNKSFVPQIIFFVVFLFVKLNCCYLKTDPQQWIAFLDKNIGSKWKCWRGSCGFSPPRRHEVVCFGGRIRASTFKCFIYFLWCPFIPKQFLVWVVLLKKQTRRSIAENCFQNVIAERDGSLSTLMFLSKLCGIPYKDTQVNI